MKHTGFMLKYLDVREEQQRCFLTFDNVYEIALNIYVYASWLVILGYIYKQRYWCKIKSLKHIHKQKKYKNALDNRNCGGKGKIHFDFNIKHRKGTFCILEYKTHLISILRYKVLTLQYTILEDK